MSRKFTQRVIFNETLAPSETQTSSAIPLNTMTGRRVGVFGRFKGTSLASITPVSVTYGEYNLKSFTVTVSNMYNSDVDTDEYTFRTADDGDPKTIFLESSDDTKAEIASKIAAAINDVQGSYLTATNTAMSYVEIETGVYRSQSTAMDYVTLNPRSGDRPVYLSLSSAETADKFTLSSARQSWLDMLVSATGQEGSFFPYTALRWEFDGNGNIGFVLPLDLPFEYVQFQATNNDSTERPLKLYISYEE